jgi:pimeloyl-ACP methyl ester carboxylesterase
VSPASALARYVGLAGAAVGVVAAGTAVTVLANRRRRERAAALDHPLGTLRGDRHAAVAEDGLELYVEVDEAAGEEAAGRPTVVFVHGYALTLDSWHFQRADLRGRQRLVFFDQRSHGRSARSRPEHSTIDQLGRDLASLLDQVVGPGPVVLAGHSMGGMTIMALAEHHPEWFGSRVVGVALISTSSGGLDAEALGFPGAPGRIMHRLAPSVVATLARTPRLVESGRRASSGVAYILTRRLAFGGPVPQEYVDFADQMLASTPFEVVADFFPGFDGHDRTDALATLAATPTVVVCGTADAITPIGHSRRIAELVSSATLVEVPGAGHMVLLEGADQVTDALEALLDIVDDRG